MLKSNIFKFILARVHAKINLYYSIQPNNPDQEFIKYTMVSFTK